MLLFSARWKKKRIYYDYAFRGRVDERQIFQHWPPAAHLRYGRIRRIPTSNIDVDATESRRQNNPDIDARARESPPMDGARTNADTIFSHRLKVAALMLEAHARF